MMTGLKAQGIEFIPWQQGDMITMSDGRAYIVQRSGEWHKVVEEQR